MLVREHCALVLRSNGFQVDVAGDGNDAWELFRQKPYDLVITDNDMPRMTGIELFVRIRGVNRKVPVLVISGSSAAEQTCLRSGFQNWRFLLKPIPSDRLIAIIREIIPITGSIGQFGV